MEVNLTKVDIRRCAKCPSTSGIIRHHKGNDKLLGRYNHRIRRNYKRYFFCVNLCITCHAIIHAIYDVCIFRNEYDSIMKLRQAYISICNEWLSSKKFDKKFTRNHPRARWYLNVAWKAR